MKDKQNLMRLNPLAVSVLLALPVFANANHTSTGISMPNGSITVTNGIPVVNINQANGNGISHNIYDKLNVGKEGVIFNNSQNGANTSLAGQVAGNANLTTGSASVILNEVTSKYTSNLNGVMEVAGDRAHLIIANPNGITCNDCSFVNSDKVTITTGTPDLVNGALNGYSVNGGIINVNGSLTSASPTAILARSVIVDGIITVTGSALSRDESVSTLGSELTVIAGNNYVNTDNEVTGTVKAKSGKKTYGIDVSKIGGMYANKISLISTEKGVGVRNAGVIAGGATGITIDANGRLVNKNGEIKASGPISIKTNGEIDNTTGKIVSNNAVAIDTNKGAITNSLAGNIMSDTEVFINSGRIENKNGKIAATNMVAIDTNGAELLNYGQGKTVGIEAGIVALKTGKLNNSHGQIKGGYIGIDSTYVKNHGGIIEATGDIDILSTGTVDNTSGLIRSANGHVKIDASKSHLYNKSTRTADTESTDALGIIAGEGGIQLSVAVLDNVNGQIASSGDVDVQATTVNNTSSKITSEKNITVKAATLNNNKSGISAESNVDIELTGNLTNYLSVLSSESADVNVQAQNVTNTGGVISANNIDLNSVNNVNNNYGLVVASEGLTVNAGNLVTNTHASSFGSLYGIYLGMSKQQGGLIGKNGVEVNAKTITNTSGRIVADNGPLTLNASGTLTNNHGLIVGAGDSAIKAGTLSNNYGTIYSSGNLTIDVDKVTQLSSGSIIKNNATGIMAADGALALNVGSNFTNYGWITGAESVSVDTNGILYNHGTIYSENEANVSASKNINNYKEIVGDVALNLSSDGVISNSGTIYSAGITTLGGNGTEVRNTTRSSRFGAGEELVTNGKTISGVGTVLGLN